MLRTITMQVRLFGGGDRALNAKGLCGFLEAMTHWNEIYLDIFPHTKPLYQSGVRYSIPEPFQDGMPSERAIVGALKKIGMGDRWARQVAEGVTAGEQFRDVPTLYENGFGDCDNVACARAAELRAAGVDASPYVTRHDRPDGGTTYHAIVRWPDGTPEDPSLMLGMGGRARMADRAEEFRRLAERREITATEILGRVQAGEPVDEVKAAKVARLLAPPPYTLDEIAGWEDEGARRNFARRM